MKKILYKNFYYVVLSIVILFAFFLRAYRLAGIPDIIYIDEASLGYNAWCIAHYGVDRYLNQMPFYAQNFEGGQSPLYTYGVVLLIKTIGRGNVSLLLVRLPGLISSMLVVIFGCKSISLLFQNRKITLMSAILLAICPYFIMHGRFALDCNLMLGCSTVALYLLAKYIQTQKLPNLIMCGIAFGIVLYSYALSYFVVPLFLIFSTLYMLYTKKITFLRSIILAVCVCLTGLPVIIFACSLLFQLEPMKFLCFTISPVATERMNDVVSSNFLENVIDIIKITLTNSFYPLDAVDKFYTMYLTSIPFIIAGFFVSVKHFAVSLRNRCFHYGALYLIFYICGLITIGLVGTHYIYRANYFFISYLYFLISGIYAVYQFVHSYRYIFIGVLGASYFIWALSFFRFYYTMYSLSDMYTYPNSLYFIPIEEAIISAQNDPSIDEIYVDCVNTEEYYYFYFPVSPYEKESWHNEDGGHGRYHLQIDYYTPIESHNAYIVRKENHDFISNLSLSGHDFDMIEYPDYYVFHVL